MSANVTAIVVAIAGVTGTLASAVVTQQFSMRSRRQDIDAERRQRAEERQAEQRDNSLQAQRQSYIALHTAAWAFRQALKDCLFNRDEDWTSLDAARLVFVNRYREAQIISPQAVVGASVPAYDALTDAYGMVKNRDRAPDTAHTDLRRYLNDDVPEAIRQMRRAMREALGITDDSPD
jgi:hypothetical protein